MFAESMPLPIALPEACLALFLSGNRSNNGMKGNVTRLRVAAPNDGGL